MNEYKKIHIDKIKPYAKNARKHNSTQIQQIMDSIKEFGFTAPLLVDTQYNLIAGHGRLEALKALNKIDYKEKPFTEVPCIICKDLSDTQIKALCLADNQIALNATWDTELLKEELQDLLESNFDIEFLGFDDSVFEGFGNDEDFNIEDKNTSKEVNLEDLGHDHIELKFLLHYDSYHKVKEYLQAIDSDLNNAIIKVCHAE